MKRHILPVMTIIGFTVLLATATSCKTEDSNNDSGTGVVQDFTTDAPAPDYPEPAAGVTAYIDTYKTNQTSNKTEDTNAALRLLSKFDELWTSGGWAQTNTDGYLKGTVKNSTVLSANITYVSKATDSNRTEAQADAAYYDDRHGKTYSTISGFGPLASYIYTGTGISTTISSVADDANVYKYDDKGSDYGDITSSSALYDMIHLLQDVRSNGASGNPSKYYFNYPRPWRLSDDSSITENTATLDTGYYSSDRTTAESYPTYTSNVNVVSALKPARGTNPSTDGGFPSGHTSESFNSALIMAYAVPERFQELLTRASDLGNNRIIAGMHSPLDVMGGRMLATAISAAGLNDNSYAADKAAAFATAHTYLKTQTSTTDATFYNYAHSGTATTDPYYDHDTNKANYLARMTYGFPKTGTAGKTAVVPKGAEVLLETRFPYLSSSQRREVLRTTAIDSGYPLLDDDEGWGRLNLFDAADGYGSFDGTIYADMDASQVTSSQNNFYALDTWRNNISGNGRLVKLGTGTLCLSGTNTYSGGTNVKAGVLKSLSANAFGNSDIQITGGTLEVASSGTTVVKGCLTVTSKGTLKLDTGTSTSTVLSVANTASLAGTLVIDCSITPSAGTSYNLISAGTVSGKFSSVCDTSGNDLSSKITYTGTYVTLNY